MQYAPIALFTYNRPDKTQRVLESLMLNNEAKDSNLFIFSDGPKNEKAVDGVRKNREYINSFKKSQSTREHSFLSVTIVERENNWGLAKSLIAGITELCNKYGKVIVVEDDLVLSPYFLKFMNDGLDKYKDDDRVGAISAYVNPTEKALPDNFFLRYFDCWGWATWERAWMLLNTDSKQLLRKMRFKKNAFDVGGNAGAYGNLYCQKVGIVDSWWVRLYASFFLNNKLTLYPGKSLSINAGFDGRGTHSANLGNDFTLGEIWGNDIPVVDIPVIENSYVFDVYKEYFDSKTPKSPILNLYYNQLKSFMRRFLYIDCK